MECIEAEKQKNFAQPLTKSWRSATYTNTQHLINYSNEHNKFMYIYFGNSKTMNILLSILNRINIMQTKTQYIRMQIII